MKQFNPHISQEVFDEILNNPEKCKEIVRRETEAADKLHEYIFKFFCSKKYLKDLVEGMKEKRG
jgi:hypothetical protein